MWDFISGLGRELVWRVDVRWLVVMVWGGGLSWWFGVG